MVIDFINTVSNILFSKNPLILTWWVLMHWGWLFVLVYILIGLYFRRLNNRRYNFVMLEKYVLLAIDVPKVVEQNLRAVEQIFSHLHGIHSGPNFFEKWWLGEVQLSISLELISIDGYIQFIIRTPEKFRDLVEAAIYAQYAEAEITEIEDYAAKVDLTFPNDEYDLYGAEWKLSAKECWPILTYPFFEHSMTQELADPMASLLENLSRLSNGEQVWIQYVISPNEDKKWRDESQKVINKILGESVTSGGKDWLYFPRQIVHGLTESLTASLVEPTPLGEDESTAGDKSERIRLSPGERTKVEALENKNGKLAYRVKMRILYIAPKEVFSKSKGVNPIKGAIKQFKSVDLNGFKEDKRNRTKADYFFKRIRVIWKQRKLLNRYKKRWNDSLSSGFILTTDELATIYHFPTETVKAPLIKKIESRKKEPPSGLPIETLPSLASMEKGLASAGPAAGEPPSDLPTEE